MWTEGVSRPMEQVLLATVFALASGLRTIVWADGVSGTARDDLAVAALALFPAPASS